MSFEEALEAYRNKFDENFPVMIIRDELEIISAIQDCLKSGEPFDPEDDPEVDYQG